MKVGTYNIHFDDVSRRGKRSWEARREGVLQIIRHHAPDILVLQEVNTWDGMNLLPSRQIPDLADHLPDYTMVGSEPRHRIESSNPILYRTAAFDLEANGVFYFAEDPEDPYSYSWGTWSPRFSRWARLRHLESDRVLYVFNVHYHPLLRRSKREASRILAERTERIAGDAPCLITGDFNSFPRSAQVRQIEERLSVRDVLFGARRGSFHGFVGVSPWPRVDYIFASDHFEIIDAGLARDRYDGLYPSDHYPLFATLELNGRTPP
jgi:endonuclease/exonuclease/phosphatase family metal-dependent hydrolase